MLRIISFTLHDHPVIGGQEFNLCNPKEDKVPNYYSIIIGPNGTGKSYLLSNLIYTFNEIKLMISREKYRPKINFSIEYQLNGIKYYISTKEKISLFKINNFEAVPEKIVLPTKWLASSVTINDKFPLLNINSSQAIPEYKYLGIRAASNNAFIKTIIKNSMLYFVDAIRKGKNKKLKSLYEALSLNPYVKIELSYGKMLKFNKAINYSEINLALKSLIEPHRNFLSKYNSVKSYRSDTYKKHIDNEEIITRVCHFVIHRLNLEYGYNKNNSVIYDVNFENNHGVDILLNEWNLVLIALDLELLDLKRFVITKDSGFSYEEASSGENHLLTSLHGIIANLEDNSLLVIDEPEISLHPNWQIDYIDILKNIVDGYSGVNTVIATHSHFLVSGVKNEESRILSIRRRGDIEKDVIEIETERKGLFIEELDLETYGWDPENILYNVFEVATLRNKYFEIDLRKIIHLISTNSDNISDIILLKEKLEKYIMPNEKDPLRFVILQVINYLNKKNAIS